MSHPPASLPIDDVRRLINTWSGGGFFRIARLGDHLHLEDIVPLSSYSLRVQTQYEDRVLGQASVPYHGGPVDDQGPRVSPWDLPVRRPTDFENRSETVPVPHTERVQTCTHCGGVGQVNCTQCQGWGKVNCTACQGKGYRERPAQPGQPVQAGQPQPMLRENCPHCFGGQVNCTTCQARGRVVCSPCAGSGRVKVHDTVTVTFRHQTHTAVLDATGVPDYLISKATGDRVVDERNVLIDCCPAVAPTVEDEANKLLKKAQAINATECIVLLQHLQVERVPLYEVVYRYPRVDSPERKLWIYGAEQHIHAPGAPTNWGRVLLLAGGALVVLAGGLAALLLVFG